MSKRHVIFRILAGLVLIGVLVTAGVMIFNAGQAQGYALGAGAGANPRVMEGWRGMPLGGHHFFFPFAPFALLFLCGVPFLFFFFFGGMFRMMRRGWGYGPHGSHMHGHPCDGPAAQTPPPSPDPGQTPPPPAA